MNVTESVICHAKSDISEQDLFVMLEQSRELHGLNHNCINDILTIIATGNSAKQRVRLILTRINQLKLTIGKLG
jgi:hypothetical protein